MITPPEAAPRDAPTVESGSNESAIDAWNGVLFDKFCRFRHLLGLGLAIHGTRAIERHCDTRGKHIIDLGCGFGDSTLELAREADRVVGIDAAPRFVSEAQASARHASALNVRHVVGDVASATLGGPYDLAFSRFGTMFFSQPVAALRNVQRCLSRGGKLCMVVWRRREDNPAMYVAEQIARGIVPEVGPSDEPTCGPGPYSMASADVTSDLLLRAGFESVRFERQDARICIGRDIDEAIELALELGPAGELLRLAKDEGQRLRPVVARALRAAFTEVATEAGVWLPSSTWIVTAEKAIASGTAVA